MPAVSWIRYLFSPEMKPAPHNKREQDPVPLLGAVAKGVDAGRQVRCDHLRKG